MSNTTASSGIGFLPLLTLLFIGLKLGGVLDWSWYWTLSPLILPTLIGFGVIAPIFAAYQSLIHTGKDFIQWCIVALGFAAISWSLNYGLYLLIG